jgi:hypothetical protein
MVTAEDVTTSFPMARLLTDHWHSGPCPCKGLLALPKGWEESQQSKSLRRSSGQVVMDIDAFDFQSQAS